MLESSDTDSFNRIDELESALRERDELLQKQASLLQSRDQRIRLLEEALRYLKADKYGASREKLDEAPGQRGLFNEVETIDELMQAVGVEPPVTATPLREIKSSGAKPGRKALASHLPRVEVRHELPQVERVCSCGGTLTEFDADISEQLDYEPAKIRVIRHIRAKYSCRGCHQGVKVAPLPAQLLPRSNASAGLLAWVTTSKYVDGLPLHRLETIAARHGIHLPRATQAAWIIAVAKLLQPLINLMDELLRASGYIRIDETPVQVLKSEKPASSEHWMWVRVAGRPGRRLILFDYDASRAATVAERLLKDARGYVQSDGYVAYDGVAVQLNLTHVGCFAHARRRFFEAIQALPQSERKRETVAHEMVRRIDALYAIEREIKTVTPEQRTELRRARAIPLLEALIARARDLQEQTLPSGKLGEALAYLTKQWPKLARYVDDGASPSIRTWLKMRSARLHLGDATGCSPTR